MYITKIDIDTSRRENYKGFVDAGYFHSVLENCFEGERGHPLWQITKNQILMVSERMPVVPSWFGRAQTKEYNLKISEGSLLHYRIVVNPTVKKDGKRIPLNVNKTENYPYCAADWLVDRLGKNGAKVLSSDMIENHIGKAKDGKVKFLAVTYEGVLLVEDEEKFDHLLKYGVGHEKAYGCGLLLVRK